MNYTLTLTPLTPLHIGSGQTIEPYEYVILDQLIKFWPEYLLPELDDHGRNRFLKLAKGDFTGLREFLRNRTNLVHKVKEYLCAVHPGALALYESRLQNAASDVSVHPFIRTGGNPYIPGSSLKGALRTAMLYHRAERPVTGNYARWIEAETFGYYSTNRRTGRKRIDVSADPFQMMKIGDSPSRADSTHLRTITVHTCRKEQWNEDIPVLREVTRAGLTYTAAPGFTCRVQLRAHPYHGRYAFTMDELMAACTIFYGRHLASEQTYLRQFPEPYQWYQSLKERYNNLPSNAFLIRLGWGSGFDAVTINAARRHPERKRSRRLTSDFMPLGWVEVTVEE